MFTSLVILCIHQFASVALWLIELYIAYAVVILLITLASVVVTARQSWRTQQRIAALAAGEGLADVLGGDGARVRVLTSVD